MKIEFREAKSVITKSNIPGIDYVINPYTGVAGDGLIWQKI